jgi:hypothetical protein
MGGGGYSSSVQDTGANTSGTTSWLGGGINAPAIVNGPSVLVLAAIALAVVLLLRR